MKKKNQETKKIMLSVRSEAYKARLGNVVFKSPKDYDRKAVKRKDKKEFDDYMR